MRKAILTLLLICSCRLAIDAQTPATIETRLLSRVANIQKWSSYGDNTDMDRLERENNQLKSDLLNYGMRSATLTHAFPRLKKKMHIVTSRDGRLRVYSWDMQTGGTLHEFDAVFQYKGKSGKVHTRVEAPGEDFGVGGFFHDLFQLDVGGEPIYMVVSTFVASGTHNGQSLQLMRISGERLDPTPKLIRTTTGLQNSIGFEYDFSSVLDRKERPVRLFKWDDKSRSFNFPVVIEDEEMPQGRVTNKKITYRFNGKYFVKLS